ncbi:MAG: peptide deformylase [Betaproteobacteria bacterium]|nr:peptide deformylase [Betaproteobacteria bacterium]
MAVRPVLRMGDPRLLQVSAPVSTFGTPELRELVHDLQDTMAALNGAGIAAPQIGVLLQVVIFGVGSNPRYPDADQVPYTVLCNPAITPLDDAEEEGWEGCLSVPGMRGVVPRHARVRYTGCDLDGIQHECDHLWGILYPMRVRDMSRFGFTEALFPGQVIADD